MSGLFETFLLSVFGISSFSEPVPLRASVLAETLLILALSWGQVGERRDSPSSVLGDAIEAERLGRRHNMPWAGAQPGLPETPGCQHLQGGLPEGHDPLGREEAPG